MPREVGIKLWNTQEQEIAYQDPDQVHVVYIAAENSLHSGACQDEAKKKLWKMVSFSKKYNNIQANRIQSPAIARNHMVFFEL